MAPRSAMRIQTSLFVIMFLRCIGYLDSGQKKTKYIVQVTERIMNMNVEMGLRG